MVIRACSGGVIALPIALDDADGNRLAAAVEEFVETRAPLFAAAR